MRQHFLDVHRHLAAAKSMLQKLPKRRGNLYKWAMLALSAIFIRVLLSASDHDSAIVYQQIGLVHDGFGNLGSVTFASLNEISARKEIIVTAANCGYLDMTLNWIEQLRSIGVSNFLVIAEDLPSYEYLLTVASRNTLPSSVFGRPFSRRSRKAAMFDSPDFDWCSRPYYLRELIRQNFSAVWIDSDAALLRNPFDVVQGHVDDVVIVDDEPHMRPIKKYRHYYCSCFVLVRPSRSAETLLSTWAYLCGNRTQDQIPLNEALDLLEGAVSWRTMPKGLYPSGFDAERLTLTRKPGWESPAWIHANWRVGNTAKEQFLSRFGLWRNIRVPINCGNA